MICIATLIGEHENNKKKTNGNAGVFSENHSDLSHVMPAC